MKNKLSDLNDHLFAQLERLSDEDISQEKIEQEAKRGEAIVAVADQILRMADLQVRAAKIAAEHGGNPVNYLPPPAIPGPQTAITGKRSEPLKIELPKHYEDVGR